MSQSPSSGDGVTEQRDNDDPESKKIPNPAYPRVNKKRLQEYEEEIEALTNLIKDLEIKQKSVVINPDGKSQREVAPLQARRREMVESRRKCDEALRKVKADMAKQNTEITRVESTLRYKREDKTTETINRLEQQLKLRNFSLSEEKRIVSEIDALKRSKRALGQYIALKREMDRLKDEAKTLRQQMDHFHNKARDCKVQEDRIRQDIVNAKVKRQEIKNKLDELYTQRRTTTAEYNAVKKEFQQQRDEQRRRKNEEIQRRKMEDKIHAQEEYEKEWKEYESNRKPYQNEIQLCSTLITYLHRFVSETETNDKTNAVTTPPGADVARHDISPVDEGLEGVYMLKKKTDETLFEGIVRPKTRKNRRDKRRSLSNKPINHSPETFDQFARLDLMAPVTTVDILSMVGQLEEKKRKFEEMSELKVCVFQPPNKEDDPKEAVEKYLESLPPPPAVLSYPTESQYDFPSLSASTAAGHDQGTASRTPLKMDMCAANNTGVEVCSIGPESAICEDSIPNTPEVSLDNQPPKFLPASSPTLSYDSGAPSLDHGLDTEAKVGITATSSSPAPSENSTLIPDESPSPVESRSDSMEETRSVEGKEVCTNNELIKSGAQSTLCYNKDNIDQLASSDHTPHVMCGTDMALL